MKGRVSAVSERRARGCGRRRDVQGEVGAEAGEGGRRGLDGVDGAGGGDAGSGEEGVVAGVGAMSRKASPGEGGGDEAHLVVLGAAL